MSYFDEASLVMIPSGYKTSKVYSVLPTDGSGDLTFSRSNDTATRVNSDGLIEKVRTNLVRQSQALATTWNVFEPSGAGTIIRTNNYATAPDGSMTATRIQNTGASVYQWVYQDFSPKPSTFSIYAKRTGATDQTFMIFGNNGAVVSGNLTATDTWQRFSFTISADTSKPMGIAPDSSGNTYDILFWGAQVEDTDIATDYIATTTAAVSVGPVANLPRLDYLDSSCPRLLLEPQRTNLAVLSEQFDQWATNGVTNTNVAISPDGYTNADRLVHDSGAGKYWLTGAINCTNGVTYTASVYAKPTAAGKKFIFYFDGSINVSQTITTTSADWTRYTHTFTATSTGTMNPHIILSQTSDFDDLLVYGYQVEEGAYATSYIPTLGASVTRGADSAYKTGISSLVSTTGTLFIDFVWNGVSNVVADNQIFGQGPQYYATTNISISNYNGALYVRINDGLTLIVNLNAGIILTAGNRYKVAFAFQNDDIVIYVNGTLRASATSGTIPTTSSIYLNNDHPNNKSVNQALVFKTRLSNADLATLTSL